MHEPCLGWSFRSDGENSSCLVANGGSAAKGYESLQQSYNKLPCDNLTGFMYQHTLVPIILINVFNPALL